MSELKKTVALSKTNDSIEKLVEEKASECARIVPSGFHSFVGALQEKFGGSLEAVLLYGSCLHSYDLKNSVVDLYAVIDDYSHTYEKTFYKKLNRFVPPNVFYMELEHEDTILRCKYGVISLDDFGQGANKWFHSYIWGRFAQPTRILYCKDEESRNTMHLYLAQATLTFLKETIPALGRSNLDSETIWTRGLSLSYNAELRPEKKSRAEQLTHLNLGDYIRLTAYAAGALPELEALPHDRFNCIVSERECRRALRRWRLRAIQGRVLSVLRLAKAVFTFSDCIDYAVWKIERHTGVKIEVTPRLQKYPLLFGWKVMWQLMRQGVMH